MKHCLLLSASAAILLLTQCKRCYDCTKPLPPYPEAVQSTSFCANGKGNAELRLEELEEDGFTCVPSD